MTQIRLNLGPSALLITVALMVNGINISLSQNKKIDSLKTVLKTQGDDTVKIKTLSKIVGGYFQTNPDSALVYSSKVLELINRLSAEKTGIKKTFFQKNEGYVYYVNSICYITKGDYDKALEYVEKAKETYAKLKDNKKISYALTCKGIIYKNQGQYAKAIEVYFEALEMAETADDQYGIEKVLGNIGSLYFLQGKFDEAIKYQEKALKISEIIKNKPGIIASVSNIGIAHFEKGLRFKAVGNRELANKEYVKAREYYLRAAALREEIGDKGGMAISYSNIGLLLKELGDYTKAMDYQRKALAIEEEMNDKGALARSYTNIGNIYAKEKKYDEAIKYIEKALALASSIGEKRYVKETCKSMAELCALQNNYKMAYEYYQKYSIKNDSLLSEESSRQLAESQTKYETEKKDKEIMVLNKDNEIQTVEIEKQKTVRNSFIGGFALVLLLAFFIFRSYLQNKKANKALKEKNETIEYQKRIVEEKQKEVMDSIHYAKRIQRSLLPTEKYIDRNLNQLNK